MNPYSTHLPLLLKAMSKTNPYSTHLPLLIEVVAKTTGSVLEVGMGEYSTPILHALCESTKRKLVSIETNVEWASNFYWLRNLWHNILCVDDYAHCSFLDQDGWDVAFIDHAPAHIRSRDIKRLAVNSMYIVVHDVEEPSYNYEPVLSQFTYRYNYTELRPHTAVVSMTHNFIYENFYSSMIKHIKHQ